jgi:Skp family chaperone for outer membrane proteins
MSESKKKKTEIEKLKEEKEGVEEELAEAMKKQEQIEHQLQRAENRADFLKDNERRRRTHRLVIKGAIVEDIAPCLKNCSDQEFYNLMDEIFSLPQVQGLIVVQQENAREGQDG